MGNSWKFSVAPISRYTVYYNYNYEQLRMCLHLNLSIAAVQFNSVSVAMILLSLVTPVIAFLVISPAYSILVSNLYF